VLSAGTIATSAAAATATPGVATTGVAVGTGTAPAAGPAVVSERDVDVRARFATGSQPVYPPAARKAEIEIDLPLDIVVDATGQVVSARAVTRAGYGLDEAAEQVVRTWRFSPAMRAGRAVPVRMRWTVQFRLR
jgi:protein TonB